MMFWITLFCLIWNEFFLGRIFLQCFHVNFTFFSFSMVKSLFYNFCQKQILNPRDQTHFAVKSISLNQTTIKKFSFFFFLENEITVKLKCCQNCFPKICPSFHYLRSQIFMRWCFFLHWKLLFLGKVVHPAFINKCEYRGDFSPLNST